MDSNLRPIVLQHGLFQTSDEFIVNSEENSIAFILANRNYDVWISNIRGT